MDPALDIEEPQEDNEPLTLVKTAGQIAEDDIAHPLDADTLRFGQRPHRTPLPAGDQTRRKVGFFVLAKFPPISPEPQETAFFTEGVMQVFLNVVLPSIRVSCLDNPAVTTFINSTRAAIPDLPDFGCTTGPEERFRR